MQAGAQCHAVRTIKQHQRPSLTPRSLFSPCGNAGGGMPAPHPPPPPLPPYLPTPASITKKGSINKKRQIIMHGDAA